MALIRPMARKWLHPKMVKTNADRILDQEGVVVEEIDNLRACGQVKIGGALWSARSAGEETIPADHIILAVGFTPRPSLAGELLGAGMEVYQVGDGRKVGSVMTAVGSGYTVGRSI